MIFQKTDVLGAYIVERIPSKDNRGYFARLYCEREFEKNGLVTNYVQMNLCQNKEKGTLRGLHYQKEKEEDKLVSCTRGRIWDVCVDTRPESASFCKYAAVELSEENGRMLYIPKGCAHGYLTLEEDCQLLYLMSEFYVPELAAGFRYDDPSFQIQWPDGKIKVISKKDLELPFIKL